MGHMTSYYSFIITVSLTCTVLGDHLYKSLAVAKMDDRLTTVDMGRKLGAVPLSEEVGLI